MSTVENLQNALRSFINIDNEDILQMLASILEYDSSRNPSKGTLTYGHLEKRFSRSKELIKDALSWAAQWRLILPVEKTGIRGMFWGDRKEILTKPVSKYDVLRIIQHLVDNAVKTGEWDAEHAVKSIFNDMSDVENELGLSILKKIAELVKEDYREEMLADFPYFFCI